MTVLSDLPRNAYLYSLRQQTGSWLELGMERFTGVFLGSFFYITYHSGYEWNRRITNEKNRAIGFVRRHGEGSKVCFLRFKGYLEPVCLAVIFLVCLLVLYMTASAAGVEFLPWYYGVAFAAAFFACAVSAVRDSLTERGQEGARVLLAALRNPDDPYNF